MGGLLNENGKLPATSVFEQQYAELEERRIKLMRIYEQYKTEISELEKLQRNVEKMERNNQQRVKNEYIT